MIRGVHHVSLHSRDLDRLRAFYQAAFGFWQVGEEMRLENYAAFDQITGVQGGRARAVMMQAGNCFIELFEWQAPGARAAEPLRPTDWGYTHFCVDVSDIESEYRRLTALGMRFVHPEPVSAGPYKSVYGYDPEGNIIEIQETQPGDVFWLDRAG